jgi:hypothetical protein
MIHNPLYKTTIDSKRSSFQGFPEDGNPNGIVYAEKGTLASIRNGQLWMKSGNDWKPTNYTIVRKSSTPLPSITWMKTTPSTSGIGWVKVGTVAAKTQVIGNEITSSIVIPVVEVIPEPVAVEEIVVEPEPEPIVEPVVVLPPVRRFFSTYSAPESVLSSGFALREYQSYSGWMPMVIEPTGKSFAAKSGSATAIISNVERRFDNLDVFFIDGDHFYGETNVGQRIPVINNIGVFPFDYILDVASGSSLLVVKNGKIGVFDGELTILDDRMVDGIRNFIDEAGTKVVATLEGETSFFTKSGSWSRETTNVGDYTLKSVSKDMQTYVYLSSDSTFIRVVRTDILDNHTTGSIRIGLFSDVNVSLNGSLIYGRHCVNADWSPFIIRPDVGYVDLFTYVRNHSNLFTDYSKVSNIYDSTADGKHLLIGLFRDGREFPAILSLP